MSKKQVEGWTYGHSEALNQDFAFRPDNNGGLELYTEDKTHYNWNEINKIKEHGEITPAVHAVKKLFNGIIIQ